MSSRLLLVCLVFISPTCDRVHALREPDREVPLDERMKMIMNHFGGTATYHNKIGSIETPTFIGKAALDGMSLYALKPNVVPGDKYDEDKEVQKGVHDMKFVFKYDFLTVDVKWYNRTVPEMIRECKFPYSTNDVKNKVQVQLLLKTTPICDLQLVRFKVELLGDFKIPCPIWPPTKTKLAKLLKESVKRHLEDGIQKRINFFNVKGGNPCDILLPKS